MHVKALMISPNLNQKLMKMFQVRFIVSVIIIVCVVCHAKRNQEAKTPRFTDPKPMPEENHPKET